MPQWQVKRSIAVVTAYMKPDGVPDFTLTEVEVTDDEHANGVHYDLVERRLGERGFEEPFIHFDETESPSFLVPAVRQHVESSTQITSGPELVYPF